MNHSDDDSVSLPAPLPAEPAISAPAITPEPAPAPAAAARPKRATWRKVLLYVFATFGLLAILLVAVVAFMVLRDKKVPAPVLTRDAVVEESMTRNYGKYSEQQQGWLFVEPSSKNTYVMQVLQRAQVEVPSDTMTGVTAVYFLVAGTPASKNDDHRSLLGLFMIAPDTKAHDGTLTETADAFHTIDGDVPVTAQDVRFEALSKDTWGWVVKITRANAPSSMGAHLVDDVVFAPHEGSMTTLATFPARGVFTAADGCEKAQALRDGVTQAASAAAVASAPADAASAPAPAASEPEEGDEGESGDDIPIGCTNASWTYKTGDVPADGFVTFSVTGGGKVNGDDVPVKTYKLVFDPKSFTYLLPADMPSF
jgi:hypothetical protein